MTFSINVGAAGVDLPEDRARYIAGRTQQFLADTLNDELMGMGDFQTESDIEQED